MKFVDFHEVIGLLPAFLRFPSGGVVVAIVDIDQARIECLKRALFTVSFDPAENI